MEQYKFGKHLDCGAKVREWAGDTSHLLLNHDLLMKKRMEAEKLRQQLTTRGLGIKGTPLCDEQLSLSSQSSSRDLTRPPTYSDHYTIGSPAAMYTEIVTHRDEELRF